MRSSNSFWAQLGSETFEEPAKIVQQIRSAMVKSLVDLDDGGVHRHLEIEIASAHDLSDLWYQRPRLLQAISRSQSREAGEEAIYRITEMFAGHFGNAIVSRFGGTP